MLGTRSIRVTMLMALAGCGGPAVVAAVGEPPPPAVERVMRTEIAAAVEPVVPDVPSSAPACTDWSATVELARLADPRLEEVSGLIASRAHPGVLYVHNDSGEPYARFFAITEEAQVLAEIAIDGAPSRDFEDIAYHDGWLYLADIGDNGARDGSQPVHDDVALVRVREPELPPERGATIHVSSFDRFVLRYADRPRDSEALFVDPTTGDFFLLSKENEGPVDVFVAHPPLSTAAPTTLEHIATLPGAGSLANAITAADISSDGGAIVVRTYLRAFLYPRRPDETVATALGRAATELPVIREWQGEAIAFSVDGRSLYSIPEGEDAPVHRLTARCDAAE